MSPVPSQPSLRPAVSIIVPVYRTEPYLTGCLAALLGQSFRAIEIIVVDDASPGDVAGAVASAAGSDPRVRLVRHTTNQGPLAARLTGARHASGDYLGFVDSDDWVEANFVDRLLATAREHDADLVQCALMLHHADGRVELQTRSGASHQLENAGILAGLLGGQMFNSLANKLIRTECWHTATASLTEEERHASFGEDLLCLFHVCARSRRYRHIDLPLYHYIRHDAAPPANGDAASQHRLAGLRLVYRALAPVLLASRQPAHLKQRFVEREFVAVARGFGAEDPNAGFCVHPGDSISVAAGLRDPSSEPGGAPVPSPAGELRLCLLQPEADAAGLDPNWAEFAATVCDCAAAAEHSVVHVAVGGAGIRLITQIGPAPQATPPMPKRLVGVPSAQSAYIAYEWLRTASFDIVCAPARDGLLFYALSARDQDLGLQGTTFCVAAGQPTLLARHLAGEQPHGLDDLASDAMERRSLALADFSIMPDPHTQAWVRQNGWAVPGLRGHRGSADPHRASQAMWTEMAGLAARRRDTGAAVQPVAEADGLPLVSVCIVHFNRPSLLRQAIESVRRQSYGRVEIIVVDDASTLPEARAMLDGLEAELAPHGGRLIRHASNRYLGAARNTAARHARGEFLLFLDDDDYARPEQVATLVHVARATGADIVNTFCDRLFGDQPPDPAQPVEERWLMLGNAPAVGMFRNLFGPAAALFRASSFQQLGGFTELRGIGCEDWEIFARASLSGMNLQNVPAALFWYRLSPGSMIQTASAYAGTSRVLTHYLAQVPQTLWPALRLAQGAEAGMGGLQDRLRQRENDLRHRDAVLRHRDALIAHRDEEVAQLTRLAEERATQIERLSAEAADLRRACHVLFGGNVQAPQAAVDAVLRSGTWRAGQLPRALLPRLIGHPPAAPAQVTTWQQAAAIVAMVRGSTWWELTGPLRALLRWLGRG